MKLWDKGQPIDREIEKFTVGRDLEFDQQLAKYDVIGSKAHAGMLAKIGILTAEEQQAIDKVLDKILASMEKGEFQIGSEFEDIHSNIEFLLTEELGDIGKKIHTARSRNDQVLVDLKLFFKDKTAELAQEVKSLFETMLQSSDKFKDHLIPGYTHFQIAMPSSVGLWLGGYAETLVDDLRLLGTAYRLADQNPLGSAAGYGSSFPIDRSYTTELLGFETLHYNSVAAQMSRGKTEMAVAYGLASLGATLGKLAMDFCLFNCQNMSFIGLPDDLTTGSSIMPHKKNPDVFELVRAKSNRIQTLPAQLSGIMTNLPSGYHRDLQLLKEVLFPALEEMITCLMITGHGVKHMTVNPNVLEDNRYKYLFSVEEVNKEVLQGLSFREAYKKVADDIKNDTFAPSRELNHTHEGSIGNLCNQEIKAKFNRTWSEFKWD